MHQYNQYKIEKVTKYQEGLKNLSNAVQSKRIEYYSVIFLFFYLILFIELLNLIFINLFQINRCYKISYPIEEEEI